MSAQKKPNWLLVAVRNALVSQVFGLLLATSGGAGVLIAVLGYVQGWPWAQIVTYALVGAAAGAALLNGGRRLLVSSNLLNKFYIHDVQVGQEVDATGEKITAYSVWVVFKNSADIPIYYRLDDVSGHLSGMAIKELPKPELSIGRAEALQEQWHSMGLVQMSPPDTASMPGSMKLKVSFGKSTNYTYDYSARFDVQVVLDEDGNVQHTRAFKR